MIAAAVREHIAKDVHSGSDDFRARVGPWHVKHGGFSEWRLRMPLDGGSIEAGVPGLEMIATIFSDVNDDGIDCTFRLPDPSMRTSADEADANAMRKINPSSIFMTPLFSDRELEILSDDLAKISCLVR
jgi:hypothetical protein